MGAHDMITASSGNLLTADVDALVNTVNTVGVMGKGLALQFKRAYPDMFAEYERAAKAGEIRCGAMHVWATGSLTGPEFIINFPTKAHWRAPSRIADIESGLLDLVRVIQTLGITSIAIPPLGAGNGGLLWASVEPLIRQACEAIPAVDVRLYAPLGPPAASAMPDNSPARQLTVGRAALIALLDRYLDVGLAASQLEVQKLMYFLQCAGQPLKLRYVQGTYGPYADNLRHVLKAVEGQYLLGFGDGSAPVLDAEPITVLPGAIEGATEMLADHPEVGERIERVLEIIEGFESMYGLELLASVHWVMQASESARRDSHEAARLVHEWTPRKRDMFTERHIVIAWEALSGRAALLAAG